MNGRPFPELHRTKTVLRRIKIKKLVEIRKSMSQTRDDYEKNFSTDRLNRLTYVETSITKKKTSTTTDDTRFVFIKKNRTDSSSNHHGSKKCQSY